MFQNEDKATMLKFFKDGGPDTKRAANVAQSSGSGAPTETTVEPPAAPIEANKADSKDSKASAPGTPKAGPTANAMFPGDVRWLMSSKGPATRQTNMMSVVPSSAGGKVKFDVFNVTRDTAEDHVASYWSQQSSVSPKPRRPDDPPKDF